MNGSTIYRGASEFDGTAIKVVMHGTVKPSKNTKTGPSVQAAFLPDRADAAKVAASGDGDFGVCGECPYRKDAVGTGDRVCYVNPMYVNTVSKMAYPDGMPAKRTKGLLRLGSYGSPASAPFSVTRAILDNHDGKHTGYFAEWDNPAFAQFGEVCMASVPTLEDARKAWSLGFRTFRVLARGETPEANEIVCPNETRGITCAQCGLCDGTGPKGSSKKSIVINAHGSTGFEARHARVIDAYRARGRRTTRAANALPVL